MTGYKHGYCKTPTWNSWRAMRKRCCQPTDISYDRYGGRGIKICKRWDRFENFLADMGERPEGYTLERKKQFAWLLKVELRVGNDAEAGTQSSKHTSNHISGKNYVYQRLGGSFGIAS